MNDVARHDPLFDLITTSKPLDLAPQYRVGDEAEDAPEDAPKYVDDFAPLFSRFDPISLARTNELASMQSRIDNKYYVDFAMLGKFLEKMLPHFHVMEIEGRRQFTYRSCYYDDDFKCYMEHHQGRRQRFKVRTREYVDGGGMKFFEIKLKGRRGLTVKHRMKSDFVISPRIEGEYLDMLQDIYTSQYSKVMPFALSPSLIVDYKRCTLVARAGGERVTLDYRLSFEEPCDDASPVRIGRDFVIVETKSADGKGLADRTMKKLKVRQANSCSKYCIGVNLIGGTRKNNKFRDTIRHVESNIIANDSSPALITKATGAMS